MRKKTFLSAIMLVLAFVSCSKGDGNSQISLSASATQVAVGQTVTVTAATSVNAVRWTASPTTVTKVYTITTSKVNYFTFSQPGVYTISASVKAVTYDSTTHQSLDSCWNHTASHACVKGVDSASIKISVL